MTGEGVGAMEGRQSDEHGEKPRDVRGENDPLSAYYQSDNENDLNEMTRFKRIFSASVAWLKEIPPKVSNFSVPFIVRQLWNDSS